MLKIIARSIARSLTRQKLFTALNLGGLALGLAVFLTMALIVRYEYNFDSDIAGADRLYQVDEYTHIAGQDIDEGSQVSFVPFPFLRQDFPEITTAIRVLQQDLVVRNGARLGRETVTLTDPEFLGVFPLPLLAGDPVTALSGPSRVIVSREMALKYFGTVEVVGRHLRIDNDAEEALITGVLAPQSPNRSMHFDLVEITPSRWLTRPAFTNLGSEWGTIWVRLRDPHDLGRVNQGLEGYMARHPGNYSPADLREYYGAGGLKLIPLREVHFHHAAIGEGGNSRALIGILGAVGLAALAAALVNYVNLATARSVLRAGEIAMRKVLGATRTAIAVMIISEAVVMVSLGCMVGLALTECALHWISAWGGWALSFDWRFVLPVASAASLLAGVLAGTYPALVLSAYRPAIILAASRTPAGGRVESALRSLLVVLQFAFAATLAICTIVMTSQAAHIRALDRGFNQGGLITIPSLIDESLRQRQRAIMMQLGRVPGVSIATRSDMGPHNLVDRDDWRRVGHDDKHPLQWGYATPGYFDAIGATLLAGRYFDENHGQDYVERPRDAGNGTSVILSRLAVERLGFPSPAAAIGQEIAEATDDAGPQTFRIIGVIDDIRFRGPRVPMAPLLYFGTTGPIPYGQGLIRYAGVSEHVIMTRLRAAWSQAAPDVAFSATSASEILAGDYRADADHGALFSLGSGVAVGIACLGLYGLSAFNAARRMQEIGIRKVMGAQRSDILALMLRQFLTPVFLANLIAWPGAWLAMSVWLSGFDERISLTPMPFLYVMAGSLAIATVTVGYQAIQAAMSSPAKVFGRAD